MKIGILSDIHVDLEHPDEERVTGALAKTMGAESLRAMIIAGDIANDYRVTLRTLKALEERSGVRCLFVPGNHDIWNEHLLNMNAWEIYEALKEHPGNLANGPIALTGDWVAVGDLGWYDYGFGGKEYSGDEFDRMQIGDRLWQDKIKAIWGRPTVEMHRFFHERLEEQLQRLAGKRIILVTHAVPIREFTVRRSDETWNYLNAFLGSPQYGELALQHSVAYSISGHVHYRREKTLGATSFICNCLNYRSQWVDNDDPLVEIRRALRTVTLT
jgi:putative phosphoesterase